MKGLILIRLYMNSKKFARKHAVKDLKYLQISYN